ncbi:MAG: hypothetical protein J0L82_15115 [Deltaproteobacteria bacterium]|jgi:hypothetical protein|nr:hypothetical protein [Deltaproteobacteria bacterium]
MISKNMVRMTFNRKHRLLALLCLSMTTLAINVGCGTRDISFDLLSESATFNQNSAEINGKIDILWVVDNSGSMQTSQQAVADNFQRFIEKFRDNGFDFQIAVTTSDGYKDMFVTGLTQSVYKNGSYIDADGNTVQAPKIIRPDTPDLDKAFIANILRGVSGSGDERVFQSLQAALANTTNQGLGFPRQDAFLSVIIVSDEDDFSWDGAGSIDNQYSNPSLHTAARYDDFLSTLTGSTPTNKKFNVNTIAILDSPLLTGAQCLTQLGSSTRKIGIRYKELSELSDGILGSLCEDFGTTLSTISNKIIELSTQFYLDRIPAIGSLKVSVNGNLVLADPVNGYVYNATNNSISFFGSTVPAAGATITVSYDPTELR